MTVTMAQIDDARDAVKRVLDLQRSRIDSSWPIEPNSAYFFAHSDEMLVCMLHERREYVEELLRVWWDQGCQEVK